MKRYSLVIVLLCLGEFCKAQSPQIDKGQFVIDLSTPFNGINLYEGYGTSMILNITDEFVILNVGGEVGYFILDRFALKVGLGYGLYDRSDLFSYKFGAKYYISNVVPVQLDYLGKEFNTFFKSHNHFIGLQSGYAFFLSNIISIEPSLRYNFSLNYPSYDVIQLQIGLSIFL